MAALSLFFGLGALRYPIGSLDRFGPGLFPLLVSSLLFTLAILMVLQSRFIAYAPLYFDVKNIAVIMLALVGFVLLSKFVNMALAIVFLVFVASLAGTAPSWKRSLVISIGLIAIAYAFQSFLGLPLRLI